MHAVAVRIAREYVKLVAEFLQLVWGPVRSPAEHDVALVTALALTAQPVCFERV
jgi:hypothetical protein